MTTRETGSLTIFFVIIVVAFFSVVALVSEGSRRLGNLGRAEDLAAEVARAAAATLDPDSVSRGNATIDIADGRARQEADKIIGSIADATIEDFVVMPDRVFVVVRVKGRSLVPGMSVDGVGSHEAFAFDPTG